MKLLGCGKDVIEGLTKYDIEGLGFETHYLKSERMPCPEELMDVEAVVCFLFFNSHDIREFKNLKVIHTTSAGLDHMPMDYIREKGIKIFNAGGVYSIPMAEFALGSVLQIYKHTWRLRRQQMEHFWQQDRTLLEVYGKRVCIVGPGSIGTETAKRFSAMGCHVTGVCRHPGPKEGCDEVRHVDELDAVLAESDIVIISTPLTDSTRHLFNRERFAVMKDGSVLVNVARGPIVDTEALIEALNSGKLMGAGIDVCEEEPLPENSPLWDMENVILTPHNSFIGDGNSRRLFELIRSNLGRFMEEQKGN